MTKKINKRVTLYQKNIFWDNKKNRYSLILQRLLLIDLVAHNILLSTAKYKNIIFQLLRIGKLLV